jgi:LysM repeat protein
MSSYIIQQGDTLSGLASKYKTTVNELLSANPQIKNPDLIYAGASLNLPSAPVTAAPSSSSFNAASYASVKGYTKYFQKNGQWYVNVGGNWQTTDSKESAQSLLASKDQGGSETKDYSSVETFDEANDVINEDQEFDISDFGNDADTPPVRRTVEDIIAEVKSAITPDEEKPVADFEQTLKDYRTQYGLEDMETQLDQLRAQEQDLLSIKESRVAAERTKPVATNVIAGRISETERQENERIAVVQRSIANLTNQLNTKYGIIDTLMNVKKMDYDAAVADYDDEMSTNISVYNAARGILEEEKTEIERAEDNARSNAQIILNAYADSGTTYDQLSATEKTNLTKLGVQSGLGSDFFANVLKTSSGKDILTTIVSADDTKATIIYKDGTTKTIATGLPADQGTEEDLDSSELKVFYKQSMDTELQKVVGTDGYVSPESWAKARQRWAANTPYTTSDFDDAFRGYVNPSHPQDYAGFESYSSGFKKLSSTESIIQSFTENKTSTPSQ